MPNAGPPLVETEASYLNDDKRNENYGAGPRRANTNRKIKTSTTKIAERKE